jgi:hypothetical protein
MRYPYISREVFDEVFDSMMSDGLFNYSSRVPRDVFMKYFPIDMLSVSELQSITDPQEYAKELEAISFCCLDIGTRIRDRLIDMGRYLKYSTSDAGLYGNFVVYAAGETQRAVEKYRREGQLKLDKAYRLELAMRKGQH